MSTKGDMTDTAIIETIKTVSTMTLPTLLLIVLWLGWKQVWVWGKQLHAMEADRDFWKELYLRSAAVTEKTVTFMQSPTGREP